MVAVLVMSRNPFSPTIVQSTLSALALHLSIIKFTSARPIEQKSILALVGPKPSKLVLIQCHSTITASNSPFTDMGIMLFSVFQEIGIDEKGAETLLENHPGLRFIPVESIRTRIRAFQLLGINSLVLPRLITKRPDILNSVEIDSFMCFIRDDLEGNIEPAQLERLLSTTEPRLLLGFEGKVRLLLHHGIPRDMLALVLNKVNISKALCLKSSEEIERTMTFLSRFAEWRCENATAIVLRKLPFILAYTAEHVKDHIEFLGSFAGLSDEEIFRIVLVYPNLFSASKIRKLHPRIDFLKQCGLTSNDIFRFLIKAPLFLSLSFEGNLAYKLVFLMKIGYQNRTKELAMAMGAVTRTSCKNMQEVIGLFLNYGLTCEDILAMSKKHPQVLQYNHESLEEKMDYLIEDMGCEVGELLAFPAFLGYKFDGRIKHRYEEKKKILGEGMSLNKLLSESAARFSIKKKKPLKNSVKLLDKVNGGED
ncbi:hypothetical protein RJ639_001767 [Escallonia herrerae]|uniref:Uncharacterized protein n=1 Tax=Escallonia herrerae TaxID=1293975 RepID=A0AA88XPF7_9ASTE|nr:hypothetical protein RJ639_001767 [Escallonia herrerae]